MLDFNGVIRDTEIDGIGPWHWPDGDDGAWQGPMENWPGHAEKFLSLVPEKKVVIQAGGCCGMYPRLLKRHFDRVYTFEPDPVNFYFLTLNTQVEGIHKFNCALGERGRPLNLRIALRENVGQHEIYRGDPKPGVMFVDGVLSVALDDLVFDRVDYLMLDVEGYEPHVIQGAKRTIEEHRPVISMERPQDEPVAFLKSLGYVEGGHSAADTFFRPQRA